MKRLSFLLLLVACGFSDMSTAGEYNGALDIGDPAPAWKELMGVDGQRHSLEDVADAKCLVVVFTSNTCPYAVDAEMRLVSLDAQFRESGARLVAINVNKGEGDRLQAMTERAQERGFQFAYLQDPSQQIARDYGATRTPEFFVFDAGRKLVYQGALDDSPTGKEIKHPYVADAIRAALEGQVPETRETPPIGCNIRYERSRRSRSAR